MAFCDFETSELPDGMFLQTCRNCNVTAIVPTRSYGRRCKANLALPGTELRGLLNRLGIKPGVGCKCLVHAAKMDQWGADVCRENIDTILEWLAEEADRTGVPFVRLVASQLVKLAIRRAEKRLSRSSDS